MVNARRNNVECAVSQQRISDELLWVEFKNGDSAALALLYQRYHKMMLEAGGYLGVDKTLIGDCIQDLFMNLWKNKSGLCIPISVKAYLLQAIRRKVFRVVRRKGVTYEMFQSDVYYDCHAVACIEKQLIDEEFNKEQKSDLLKAITLLSQRQQQAVYLRFYANMSYTEIAAKMTISIASIYNLISKAMYNMGRELKKMPMHTL